MKAPQYRYEPSQRKLSKDDFPPTPPLNAQPDIDVFAVGEYSSEFTATMRQSAHQHHFLGLSHIQQYSQVPTVNPPTRMTCAAGRAAATGDLPWLCPVSAGLNDGCNDILDNLMPTKNQLTFRVERVAELCTLLHQALRSFGIESEIQFYFFGSVHLRTVLPDGDNDVAIIIDDDSDPNLVSLLHADYLPKLRDYLSERYPEYVFVTSLVFAEVRLLKLVYEGMNFDITIGQRGGRYTAQFLHHVDVLLGVGHLFKRTLLLLKSWCNFEARILGAQGGYLGTYSLTVMLMAMMNDIPLSELRAEEPTPAQILARFLQYYSTFDFDTNCVTIFGPVPLYGRSSFPERSDDYAVTEAVLQQMMARYMPGAATTARTTTPPPDDASSQASAASAVASNASTPRASSPAQTIGHDTISSVLGQSFPVRHMHVLDPLRPGSNLCRGICRSHMLRIQNAFREGHRRICKQSKEVDAGNIIGEAAAAELFSHTLDACKKSSHYDAPKDENLVACNACLDANVASPFCVNLRRTGDPLITFFDVSQQNQNTDWSAQVSMPPPTVPVAQNVPANAPPAQRPAAIPRPSGAPPFISHAQVSKSAPAAVRTPKDKPAKSSKPPTAPPTAAPQKDISLDNQRQFPSL